MELSNLRFNNVSTEDLTYELFQVERKLYRMGYPNSWERWGSLPDYKDEIQEELKRRRYT